MDQDQNAHLLDDIIGKSSGCSRNICISDREIVSKFQSSLERDECAIIDILRNNLSRHGVERLDYFLHGIAHSVYLSKKTPPSAILLLPPRKQNLKGRSVARLLPVSSGIVVVYDRHQSCFSLAFGG